MVVREPPPWCCRTSFIENLLSPLRHLHQNVIRAVMDRDFVTVSIQSLPVPLKSRATRKPPPKRKAHKIWYANQHPSDARTRRQTQPRAKSWESRIGFLFIHLLRLTVALLPPHFLPVSLIEDEMHAPSGRANHALPPVYGRLDSPSSPVG